MFTEAQLRDIVMRRIEADEGLGTHTGGSGHLGHIDAQIEEIGSPVETARDGRKAWKVTYVYVKSITTEFTIYPDNPPMEFVNRQTALISQEGEVMKVLETETLQVDERFMVTEPVHLDEEDGE